VFSLDLFDLLERLKAKVHNQIGINTHKKKTRWKERQNIKETINYRFIKVIAIYHKIRLIVNVKSRHSI
jgi:hypothetical protein